MGKNVDAAETSHHNFMEKAIPAFSTLMKHAQRGAEEMALEYLRNPYNNFFKKIRFSLNSQHTLITINL